MRNAEGRTPKDACRLSSTDALTAVLLALTSLILYVATAAPSVATLFDDSLEFQVVLPALGIAHPSGYPLYTLLGKLFTLLLPLRDPAGRANLFSALAAAAAAGFFYLAARRLAGSRPAALTAALAFAISPAWWSQATLAEVYALHGLLVVLFIYCLLRWEEIPRQDAGIRGREPGHGDQNPIPSPQSPVPADAWLTAASLVCGLGLAHHRMIALLLPAALVFVLWREPALIRQPRRWLRPLIAACAPLLLYVYLPLRGQSVGSLDGAFRPTLAGTLDWITARGYSVFLTGNPFGVRRDAGFIASLFLEQSGVLLILAALFGLAWGWRLGLRRWVFLLLATAGQIGFAAAYKVEDVAVFLIPAFMLAGLWAAIGLVRIFDSAAINAAGFARQLGLPGRSRPVVFGAVTLLVAAVVLFQPLSDAVRSWPSRDRSRAWGVYDYGQDMLSSTAPGGRVVGLVGETTLLRYFRDVLSQRSDLTVVPADAEADRFAAVDAALADGAPVYLTRDLPGAAQRYSLDAAGPLIAVSPKAAPAIPPAGQAVGAGVLLVDAEAAVRLTHAGPAVRLNLTWAAAAPVREELKVSARLLDGVGKTVVQDDRVPVLFAYPTTAWAPGELVDDVYDLALPKDAPSGDYNVLIVLYRAANGAEVGRARLLTVAIPRQ